MLTTVTSATAGCCQETVEEMKEERESRKRQERMQRKHSTEDKPWRKTGADITDYFNYGFTEETWEAFYLKQKKMRASRREMASVCKRIGEKHRANREERAGGTDKVDRQHQKEWRRPCSASDSHSLFPRRCDSACSSSQDDWSRRRHDSNRSSNRDCWSGGGRKSSSSTEDRATHLFTSPDSMCPSDPYFQRSPKTLCVTTDRREGRVSRRDSEECREQQYEERKRRRTHKEDKPSCRNATPQKEQDKDRVRSHRGRRGHRGGKREKEKKRKRQNKETPLPESKINLKSQY